MELSSQRSYWLAKLKIQKARSCYKRSWKYIFSKQFSFLSKEGGLWKRSKFFCQRAFCWSTKAFSLNMQAFICNWNSSDFEEFLSQLKKSNHHYQIMPQMSTYLKWLAVHHDRKPQWEHQVTWSLSFRSSSWSGGGSSSSFSSEPYVSFSG